MLKITHICNNYISSKVHLELIKSLSLKGGIEQFVYVPVRHKDDIGKNFICNEKIKINYFNYMLNLLKFFPLIKIFIVILGFWFSKINRKSDLIVAHNFWSDGMVAFINHIFYKTPYILVVRNTDINIFLPKLKHYHWLMALMVKKSNGLVFVNKKYQDFFENKYPKIYQKSINNSIIFNGVNNYWLDNIENYNTELRGDNLIYVGSFNKNKNISAIISASEKLLKKRPNLKLFLVGGTEDELKRFLNINHIPDFIHVMGNIIDKDELRKLYLMSKVFIMPSFFETFGLVYIEALSQGCSVIHSKGQGIDGIFDKPYILSVDPYNIDDISDKIDYLIDNFSYKAIDVEFEIYLKQLFNWDSIADQYLGAF